MSINYNGVNTKSFSSNNSLEACRKLKCTDASAKENFAVETAFRGFRKVPFVTIYRHDITPYLNDNKLHYAAKKGHGEGIALHTQRLAQKCLVKIVRDDLDKLRHSVSVSSTYSSDSESSDFDPVTMGHLKCKICDKQYSSEKKLQNHQQNKHMIVYGPESTKPQKRVSFSDHVIIHEVKEYHKCRKCTKIFEDYKSLRVHMKQRHKKRKCYICHYCSKNFVDRMFFKVHIKLHCDVCGLLLPTKAKYLEHRRNVCRVMKLYKCKTCQEAFFKFMDLKDHSFEHISTYFICDICKDQFKTKCAVSHHINYLHSKKRPTALYSMRNLGTERLYLCNFCDESSVDRNLIESHVQLLPDLTNRAMTGYKDYYFCDQCLQKFDTETDMLQHKWTHFLKTSDNSQLRPKSILRKKTHGLKTTYKVDDAIPEYLKPNVVLEKIKIAKIDNIKFGKVDNMNVAEVDNSNIAEVDNINVVEVDNTNIAVKEKFNVAMNILTESEDMDNAKSFDITNGYKKKALIDPKSKKTLLSKFQCQQCGKFYSTNYCLSRHVEMLHNDYVNLRCHVCEETFVWPSLLKSHKCIRLNIPEMPFDDARPEIHFDNLHEITQNGFNISDSDDYMNTVDFEIPAPIVELTEYGSQFPVSNVNDITPVRLNETDKANVTPLGYKLIMQEVPIEF